MSAHTHESCVSEVSSTISRLRLHSSNSQPYNVEQSRTGPPVLEVSENTTVECELKPYTIPVVSNMSSVSVSSRAAVDTSQFQIPIIGYEVMEERARFTVYKLRIENKTFGDCWFVFRRYTDFVRLHVKLKRDFPSVNLVLPRKRWFGDNFNSSFLEERMKGLQALINAIVENPQMYGTKCVRDFFCLDEPPSYADAMEESRPIFDALEETIYHLRCQLRDKEWELQQMQAREADSQLKMNQLLSLVKNNTKLCSQCKSEIRSVLTKSDEAPQSPQKSSSLL